MRRLQEGGDAARGRGAGRTRGRRARKRLLERGPSSHQSAALLAQAIRTKVASEEPRADKSVKRFYAKTPPWFKAKSGRRHLREGTDSLRGAFDTPYEAYGHLALAVQALSNADFVTYDAESAIAQAARDGSVSLFDAGIEELHGLL